MRVNLPAEAGAPLDIGPSADNGYNKGECQGTRSYWSTAFVCVDEEAGRQPRLEIHPSPDVFNARNANKASAFA